MLWLWLWLWVVVVVEALVEEKEAVGTSSIREE
jgi:hypothetical protein